MYSQVEKMTPVAKIYEQQLLTEGVIDNEGVKGMR
jgi:2-oxoglutarate dehydrogenase complex dehydrogenase (E1) component-like enzyme